MDFVPSVLWCLWHIIQALASVILILSVVSWLVFWVLNWPSSSLFFTCQLQTMFSKAKNYISSYFLKPCSNFSQPSRWVSTLYNALQGSCHSAHASLPNPALCHFSLMQWCPNIQMTPWVSSDSPPLFPLPTQSFPWLFGGCLLFIHTSTDISHPKAKQV